MGICSISLAILFLSVRPPATNVGFQQITVPDPGGKPLAVGIWYPSNSQPSARPLDSFTQIVSEDPTPAGTRLPLVLISHGSGSSLAGHYDTALALARAGFVVAAVTHTGDNNADQSYAGNIRDLTDRPRQLKCVLDYILSNWTGRGHLDGRRVGIFGFSLGGFTALVEIGGIPRIERLAELCSRRPDAPECLFVKQRHGDQLDAVTSRPTWAHDERIKAAVIAGPAVSVLFGGDGLRGVTIPVQLWRARDDQQVPDEWNTALVRKGLPRPVDEHVAPGGHFVFLAPCSDALARVAPQICQDPPGVDRVAFHREFDESIVIFFKSKLKSP